MKNYQHQEDLTLNTLDASFFEDNKNPLSIQYESDKAIHPSKNQWGQVYNKDLVVMQNRMLHAISQLTLNERRLVLLLATIVRGAVENNPMQKVFTVRASEFGEMYNIPSRKRYEILEEVSKSLHGKVFYFWDFDSNATAGVLTRSKKKKEVGISWIGRSVYRHGEGCVDLLLIDDVIEMLCIFDRENAFTKHKKDWITKLGAYGIVLLQQIIVADRPDNAFKESKDSDSKYRLVNYTIEFLRAKFDCVNRYETYGDFKRYVIDKAIKDIHKHTPYRIEYNKKLTGRAVSSLDFVFFNSEYATVSNLSNSESINTENKDVWAYFKMTNKQLSFFGEKLSKINGVDVKKVQEELMDIVKQKKHIDGLKKLGFSPSGWYGHDEVLEMQRVLEQQKQQKQQILEIKRQEQESFNDKWKQTLLAFEKLEEEQQIYILKEYLDSDSIPRTVKLKISYSLDNMHKFSIKLSQLFEKDYAQVLFEIMSREGENFR